MKNIFFVGLAVLLSTTSYSAEVSQSSRNALITLEKARASLESSLNEIDNQISGILKDIDGEKIDVTYEREKSFDIGVYPNQEELVTLEKLCHEGEDFYLGDVKRTLKIMVETAMRNCEATFLSCEIIKEINLKLVKKFDDGETNIRVACEGKAVILGKVRKL